MQLKLKVAGRLPYMSQRLFYLVWEYMILRVNIPTIFCFTAIHFELLFKDNAAIGLLGNSQNILEMNF